MSYPPAHNRAHEYMLRRRKSFAPSTLYDSFTWREPPPLVAVTCRCCRIQHTKTPVKTQNLADIALSMNALIPRANDILANLPASLLARLHQWLLDGVPFPKICEQLAKPHPDGASLEVSTSTISRYRKRLL